MALADILKRIDADAGSDASALVAEAEARSEALLAETRSVAERDAERVVARARTGAEADAATLVATAKLAVRDRELAVKRELVDEALSRATARLADLPPERAAAFLAGRIVAAASGGERVLVADADRDRLGAPLRAEVERLAPGLKLEWSADPAPVASGCVLEGDRVRADLSVETAVAEARAGLEMVVSRALFGAEG